MSTVSPTTTVLTPTGMLGYGFPIDDFRARLEEGVDVIVVDSGSTDPGPYQLGLGATLVSEEAYARDLRPLLEAVNEQRIPLLISSAGGAGTRSQVDGMVELIDRLAREGGFALNVAAIYADIAGSRMSERLAGGHVHPNVRGELPTAEDIDASRALVAQMGAEPFSSVIEGDTAFDVIVAGRAYDPAPHAAWAISKGVDAGIAWHMGKILECGGACCEPKGGGVVARVYPDSFELTPMSPYQACTPLSAAAHTLYEKARPDLLPGPSGVLDVAGCAYEAIDGRSVRVTGSRLLEAEHATVKVEGAKIVGHRAVFIGGIRDPILIDQLDEFLHGVETAVGTLHHELVSGEATVHFHVYGRDGVMGPLEPVKAIPHEVGVLGEITAATEEKAKAIATMVRVAVLHLPYEGQLATAGNLALPLSPMDNPVGPVCAFSVFHVVDADGLDLFEISQRRLGAE